MVSVIDLLYLSSGEILLKHAGNIFNQSELHDKGKWIKAKLQVWSHKNTQIYKGKKLQVALPQWKGILTHNF